MKHRNALVTTTWAVFYLFGAGVIAFVVSLGYVVYSVIAWVIG